MEEVIFKLKTIERAKGKASLEQTKEQVQRASGRKGCHQGGEKAWGKTSEEEKEGHGVPACVARQTTVTHLSTAWDCGELLRDYG